MTEYCFQTVVGFKCRPFTFKTCTFVCIYARLNSGDFSLYTTCSVCWFQVDPTHNLDLKVLGRGQELARVPVARWRFDQLTAEDAFDLACHVPAVQDHVLPHLIRGKSFTKHEAFEVQWIKMHTMPSSFFKSIDYSRFSLYFHKIIAWIIFFDIFNIQVFFFYFLLLSVILIINTDSIFKYIRIRP